MGLSLGKIRIKIARKANVRARSGENPLKHFSSFAR
jgi:hypothetical protein